MCYVVKVQGQGNIKNNHKKYCHKNVTLEQVHGGSNYQPQATDSTERF